MIAREEYSKMIKRCLRCSICKWIPQLQIKSHKYATACPAIDMYNFHPYSGGGKIILALALEMNKIKPSENLRDIVYKCTECGSCAVSCKFLNDLEPLEIIMKLREKLVDSGYGPMPEQKQYVESIKTKKNPYNEQPNTRSDWLPDDIEIDKNAKTLYFVGCTSSYRRKEIAIATARILNIAGIPFKLLFDEELCCGSPVLRIGDSKSFENILEKNIDMIETEGIETVIFSCAGCYDTFKVDYPLFKKYKFKILHVTEFINQLIEKEKLHLINEVPMTVTYHDPCHLGRNAERYEEWNGDVVEIMPLVSINVPPKPKRTGSNGVYDAPRKILEKIPGVKLVEMERTHEYAYCCGAGGGVKSAFPNFALTTSKTRIQEAEDTGADILVSTCPFCYTNLKDGIEACESSMEFYDLTELILKSLGQTSKKSSRNMEEK